MINTKKLVVFFMKNRVAMYEISIKFSFHFVCFTT